MLPDWRIEIHGPLDSTQALLRRRLSDGEEIHGVVVRASEQTAGVGRRGRSFASLPGGSYQSLAVSSARFGLAPRDGPVLALEVGLGIAEALGRCGAKVQVKWPNDLLYLGRKLGGILCEWVSGHVLIGVGVNVDNPVPSGATALRGWGLELVGDAVLEGVRLGLGSALVGVGLAERFGRFDALVGREVELELAGGVRVRGAALGIDGRGCLLVEGPEGRTVVGQGTVLAWLGSR